MPVLLVRACVLFAVSVGSFQGLSSTALVATGPAQVPVESEESLSSLNGLESLSWGPTRNGIATAIAEGDPRSEGRFTMMLKLDDGAWIPPHFHNVEKRLVVIQGTLRMGEGKVIDEDSTRDLEVGGVAVVAEESWHYEGARGATLIALIADGPFQTTFAE